MVIKGFPLFFIFSVIFILIAKYHQSEKAKILSKKQSIHLSVWAGFIPISLIRQFEEETKIHVELSYYSSNEEFLAKLQAGFSGYDLSVVTSYMVSIMKKLNLLCPLLLNQIPKKKLLDYKFFDFFDESFYKYSVPYVWGITGIAVNKKLFSGKIQSWKDLFLKEELNNKFSLLDDSREVIGAALKALGYSLNSTDDVQLKAAEELLLKAKKRVKSFTTESKTALLLGDVAIAHTYVSDALQVKKRLGDFIEIILPEEGSSIWVDHFIIPKGAKNIDKVHKLINFLIQGNASLCLLEKLYLVPVHKIFIPTSFRENSVLFPPQKFIEKSEWIQDLGEKLIQWDRMWTRIKAF